MSFRRTGWQVKDGEEKSYAIYKAAMLNRISFLTRPPALVHAAGSKGHSF